MKIRIDEKIFSKVSILETMLKNYDSATYSHCIIVGYISCLIGYGMGLDTKKLCNLYLGGLLHDIGKIYIPKYILNKDGKLSKDEFELIRDHPVNGYNLIKSIGLPDTLAVTILTHHERYNGAGYPFKLLPHEVPIEAKIISVVDSLDAMISRRNYRKAVSFEQALVDLSNNKNFLYDPRVVDYLESNLLNIKSSYDSYHYGDTKVWNVLTKIS